MGVWIAFGKSVTDKECKEMLDQWMEINMADKDPSLVYDDVATTLMLDNFEYLGLKGSSG